jgi:hypothetical protein
MGVMIAKRSGRALRVSRAAGMKSLLDGEGIGKAKREDLTVGLELGSSKDQTISRK